jgi:hypothetical protein
LPEAANLAVAAFVKDHTEGRIDPVRGLSVGDLLRNSVEPRGTVVETHAFEQLANEPGLWPATNAHQVFALDLTRGVHEAMGQLTVGRKKQ